MKWILLIPILFYLFSQFIGLIALICGQKYWEDKFQGEKI